MLIFFMLGIVVYDWKELLSIFGKFPKMAYIATFACAYLLSVSQVGAEYLAWIKYLLPILGIAAVVSLSKLIEHSNIPIDLFMITSNSSYIIYLFHTTFEGFAKALIFKIPYLSNISDGGMFLVGAVFVVACGVILPIILNDKVFNRYSTTRILLGLK